MIKTSLISFKTIIRQILLGVKYPSYKAPPLVLHPKGDFISDKIRLFNAYYEIDLIHYIYKNFDTSKFLDIGANIGNHSNFFERQGSDVFAFEPSLSNFNLLRQNVKSKNIYNVALSDFKGEDELVTFKSAMGASYVRGAFKDANFKSWGTGIRLEQIKIDKLDNFSIKPTFIKIDVEGSELNVLKGGIQTINANKPVICIEIHTDKSLLRSNFAYSRIAINSFFNSIGYSKLAVLNGVNFFYVHGSSFQAKGKLNR